MVVIHIVLWSYGIQRQATRHESSILPWPPGVMRYCISSVHLADSLGFLSPPREKAHPKQQTRNNSCVARPDLPRHQGCRLVVCLEVDRQN